MRGERKGYRKVSVVGVYEGFEIRADIQFQYVYDPSGELIQIFDKADEFENIKKFLDDYKRQLKQ